MTLGGLALAIGILVDNAMVEIENINRNLELGKPLMQAILNSASRCVSGVRVDAVRSASCSLPVFMLTGVAAFVFAPLALAVVFAMMARTCCRARWCR